MLFGLAACGGNGGEGDSSAPISSEGGAGESSTPVGDPASSDDPADSDTSANPDSPDSASSDSAGTSTTTAGRSRTTATTSGKGTATAVTAVPISLSTANEKPITYDTSILYNEMHSESDPQAEAMKKAVLNAQNTVKPSTSGTTYYVSYKGDDKNNGKSAATAWRTTQRVREAIGQFKTGDVVLFERGGVYRGTMQVVSGMRVGAYGSGVKPQLYAGPCNVADAKYWEKTKYTNVWKLSVKGMSDVGNIVFDHGKVCASTTRMFKENLITDKAKKPQDFYYYHNLEKGYIYLYYSKGNPGAAFDSIELCPKDSIITRKDNSNSVIAEDIVIDNLCLKYSGSFGVVFSAAKNITVTNCEVGYIGGSMIDSTGRYGNGIEFNSHINGALIKNNWIYQCYDAGYTNQGRGARHENITVDANLIEYCPYNIEVYCDKDNPRGTGYVRNTVYENNILRFAGYGFGTLNRFGSDTTSIAHISGVAGRMDAAGFVIRNNVMDTSYHSMVKFAYSDGVKGPKFSGNTYIQWNDTNSCLAQMRDADNPEHDTKNMIRPSTSQATLEASVKKLESSSKYVKFYAK